LENNFIFGKWINKIFGKFCLIQLNKINTYKLFVYEQELFFAMIIFLSKHSHCRFKILTDITAVDFPMKQKRFNVVYQLLSIDYNAKMTIKTYIHINEKVPSVVNIFKAANWHEREVFDMFGIFFENHPDLRRILTDYGFDGYPLRKDFPLSGFVEVRYDLSKKRVVCESVEFSQQFRIFKFNNTKQLKSSVQRNYKKKL